MHAISRAKHTQLFQSVMSSHAEGSQYARTIHGEWVCATSTRYKQGVAFFCECPDKHKVKLVKSSGDTDKRHFRDYFAHITTGFKRDRDEKTTPCRSGGESQEHRNAKHKLREMVGKFSYVSKRCTHCKTDIIEDSRGASIELEIQSNDKRWRYDCMLVRDGINIAALEIYHTHATTKEKIIATRSDGVQIAEFRAEDVNEMQDGTCLMNLCPVSFTCHECLLLLRQSWILQCYIDDQNELHNQEKMMYTFYLRIYHEKIQKLHRPREEIQKQNEKTRPCSIMDNEHTHPLMHYYHPVQWNSPYAIVNNGRALSYGHPRKPELNLSNNPIPPFDTKFDYTVPVMGQPSDHKKPHE